MKNEMVVLEKDQPVFWEVSMFWPEAFSHTTLDAWWWRAMLFRFGELGKRTRDWNPTVAAVGSLQLGSSWFPEVFGTSVRELQKEYALAPAQDKDARKWISYCICLLTPVLYRQPKNQCLRFWKPAGLFSRLAPELFEQEFSDEQHIRRVQWKEPGEGRLNTFEDVSGILNDYVWH